MWNRDAAPQTDDRTPQGLGSPAHRPEERRVIAWVGKSVVFKGDLISSEDMSIDGRVEGTIEVRDNTLTIGPDAHIQADIVARAVIVYGAVVGSITASDKIDIRDKGSIEGDVLTPRLAMADGALFRGKVDTGNKTAVQDSRRAQLATA
jgi:cytoskeletal protein CcmA (bactofilin family)